MTTLTGKKVHLRDVDPDTTVWDMKETLTDKYREEHEFNVLAAEQRLIYCHSGNFLNEIRDDTQIASYCTHTRPS